MTEEDFKTLKRILWGQSSSEPTYEIVANEGQGDCLFLAFASASGKSVTDLRRAVADSMNNDKLQTLQKLYKDAKENNENELLANYGWMEGVVNLEDLRKKVQTQAYWGDEMALPALEEQTNLTAVVVKDGEVQQRLDPMPSEGPWIVLLLENVHYQLLRRDDTVVFNEYPNDVIEWVRNRHASRTLPKGRKGGCKKKNEKGVKKRN